MPTKQSKQNGSIDAQSPLPINLAINTLTGDLRDFILNRLRYEQDARPWNQRDQKAQVETVRMVEASVRASVQQAVEIIAAAGLPTVRAKLESVAIKDGIKATLTLSRFDEQRHKLIDATGATVMLVVADVAEFEGERAPVEIAPDQPDLMPYAEASSVN